REVAGPLVEVAGHAAGAGDAADRATATAAARSHAGALVEQRGVGGGPAVVHVADAVLVGHLGVGEEHLVEHGVAGHLLERPDLDARLVHVDGEPGDALVLRGV